MENNVLLTDDQRAQTKGEECQLIRGYERAVDSFRGSQNQEHWI